MDGTSGRRIGRQLRLFWWENGRLLIFLLLFLFGVGVGCPLLSQMSKGAQSVLSALLKSADESQTIGNTVALFGRSFLFPGLLLLFLMMTGLSAIGAPIPFLVPMVYGIGVGMEEAYYLTSCGFWKIALLVVLPTMVMLWAMLMGSCESLRMTLCVTGQLLPRFSRGNLWSEFKRYLLRYCVFFGLLLFSVAIQTIGFCLLG